MSLTLEVFQQGLRCQDVHSGLRNVDPNSPLLTPLADTRVVGMAATLAGLIRDRDVVQDAQSLRSVAAAQLDVDPLAFNEVILLLADVGFVQSVKSVGGKVTSFTEHVPIYDDLYGALGQAWAERSPTELEQQLLLVVNGLSATPTPVESLESAYGLDRSDLSQLLDVGQGAGLIQVLPTPDGRIAYSPFFGFENPQLISDLVREHGASQLSDEFEQLRSHQGLALDPDRYPLITDAVARGLVMAPAVTMPNGREQGFAALPYSTDASLLTARKPVLDKALAVLACLRSAELDGGYSSLTSAGLVNAIDKLLDPNRGFLLPHSSHERQYQLIYRAGIIAFDPDPKPGGNWVMPRFVDTTDNREALLLARDLLTHGEAVQRRVDDALARSVLDQGDGYLAPMQTMARTRMLAMPRPDQYRAVFEAAMGRAAL